MRVPTLPSRSRGVVVPRVERAPATLVAAVRGTSVRTGRLHTAAAAAVLTALLVLHLGAADAAGPASVTARALVVSDQARRYLGLAYGSSPTEFMGCMIGQVHGPVVFVQRIAPADVDPAHSTQTHVLPRQTCEQAGWQGTVGIIHSHPGGERCFYYFPAPRSPARTPRRSDGSRIRWTRSCAATASCGSAVTRPSAKCGSQPGRYR